MKIVISLLVFCSSLCIATVAKSQCETHSCDPQLTGSTISVSCLSVGGAIGTLTTGWAMGGGDPTCTVPPGSWRILISLPLTGIYGTSSVLDVTGSGFDWSYSAVNKTVTGINNGQMNWLASGNVVITVRGLIANSCNSVVTQSQISIMPTILGGCPQAYANQIGNDVLTAATGVQAAPLPITLTSFNARNGECGEAKLDWTVEKEVNSDFIALERSTDGSIFETVYKVKSLNSGERREYNFIDKNLVSGQQYLYRLKQVDLDGRIEIFTPISLIAQNCNSNDYDLVVFPNPALDRTTVSVKGASVDDHGNIVIINNIGQSVMIIPYTGLNTVIDVKVHNLPPGIYNVGVENNNLYPHKRFIKIE